MERRHCGADAGLPGGGEMSTEQEAAAVLSLIDETAVRERETLALSNNGYENMKHALSVLEGDDSLYVMNGSLVEICTVEGQLKEQSLGKDLLGPVLERNINFTRFDGRGKGKYKDATAPPGLIAAINALDHYPGLRVVTGFRYIPFIWKDGSVVTEQGYHRESGIYLSLGDEYRAISDEPTSEEEESAVVLISDILKDFPFDDDADLAAALAMIMTPMVAAAVDHQVPLFGINAHQPGSGKTLLSKIPGVIAKESLVNVAPGSDRKEFNKTFYSVLRKSPGIVIFDNVVGSFGTEIVASYLTSPKTDFRILGVSHMGVITKSSMLIVNGNNFTPCADLGRRILPIQLVDKRPIHQARTYKYPKLLETIATRRVDLVHALLTLIKAHWGAESHNFPELWPSFNEWARVVVRTLLNAGFDDPLRRRGEYSMTMEPVDKHLGMLLHTMHLRFGRRWMRAKEILAAANQQAAQGREKRVGDSFLWEATEGLCEAQIQHITTAALGKKLSGLKGRIVEMEDGAMLRLQVSENRKKGSEYRVEPLPRGEVGGAKFNPP